MKNKNLLMLISSSVKTRKLAAGLFCGFLMITSILVLLAVEIIFPLSYNIEHKINDAIINRELYVTFTDRTPQNEVEKIINKIKQVEHISSVYLQPETRTVSEKTGVFSDMYTLSYLHSGYIPEITAGRSFNEGEKNVCLVPDIISDKDMENNSTRQIDGKTLIGKELLFSDENNVSYKCKVTGTYSTVNILYNMQEVIIPQYDLLAFNESTRNAEQSPSPFPRDVYYSITVDYYKNVSQAKQDISKIFPVEQRKSWVDAESYNIALTFIIFALLIFIIMAIVGLFAMLQSNVKTRKKELALYRSLGYRSKNLFYILYAEHLIFGISSIILGTAITILLNIFVINPYLQTLVGGTIMQMNVGVSPAAVAAVILIFVAVLVIICKSAVKKSEKIDLTILLKE